MAMSTTLKTMATSPISLTSSSSSSSPFLSGKKTTFHLPKQNLCMFNTNKISTFKVQAAKLPDGVVLPKTEPKFKAPFLGFTKTAEVWNSRACMIGLIGTFIVELILNKGILQVIGVDIGKGLDIPL